MLVWSRSFKIAIAMMALLGPPPATADSGSAGPHVVMSHRCVVDKGRLLVLSVPEERHYRVVGPRDETPVGFCRVGTDCRHFMVHRFALACEGGVVPWIEVAAALGHQYLGRTTIDQGRLLLRPYEGLPGEDPARRRTSSTLTFPQGHAPLTEVGARLVDTEPARAAVIEVVRETGTIIPAAAASEHPLPWLTVVEHEKPRSGRGGWLWFMVAGVVTVAGVVALAALVLRRATWQLRARRLWQAAYRFAVPEKDGDPDARACEDLALIADAQLGKLTSQIGALSTAQPLRRALSRELVRHRERLARLKASDYGSPPDRRRTRGRLEVLVTEMARLQDIVDGAVRSVDGGKGTEPVTPLDRRTAYEVLGVAPDVNERVVKKLVEALRACWHPDLAKDEADRRAREERIKEINVAWDLITGKRQEA